MKSKKTRENLEKVEDRGTVGKACLKFCRRILAQIRHVKAAVLAEARVTLKVQDRMLRLALDEAEGLAKQTFYPHLVFPALAAEKIQELAVSSGHQRSLREYTRN